MNEYGKIENNNIGSAESAPQTPVSSEQPSYAGAARNMGTGAPQMQNTGMSAPQMQNMGMNMPQMQNMNQGYQTGINPAQQKSKLVVLLLAIFVGGWGVHNFYIGENEKGMTKIITTAVCNVLLFITGLILPILNFVFLIPIVGVEIWALIEGINVMTGQVKTDARGIPFKD